MHCAAFHTKQKNACLLIAQYFTGSCSSDSTQSVPNCHPMACRSSWFRPHGTQSWWTRAARAVGAQNPAAGGPGPPGRQGRTLPRSHRAGGVTVRQGSGIDPSSGCRPVATARRWTSYRQTVDGWLWTPPWLCDRFVPPPPARKSCHPGRTAANIGEMKLGALFLAIADGPSKRWASNFGGKIAFALLHRFNIGVCNCTEYYRKNVTGPLKIGCLRLAITMCLISSAHQRWSLLRIEIFQTPSNDLPWAVKRSKNLSKVPVTTW